MNCESWLVPKNELITDERVLALITLNDGGNGVDAYRNNLNALGAGSALAKVTEV